MRTVNDLMTVNPDSVEPDTTLRQMLTLMKWHGYRQLPVTEGDKLVGIVTDRDLRLVLNSPMVLHNQAEDQKMMDTVTAASIMTADPFSVTPETPLSTAADMLSLYKFGALPVVEGETLVGILSVTDFLDLFVSKKEEGIEETAA